MGVWGGWRWGVSGGEKSGVGGLGWGVRVGGLEPHIDCHVIVFHSTSNSGNSGESKTCFLFSYDRPTDAVFLMYFALHTSRSNNFILHQHLPLTVLNAPPPQPSSLVFQ